jgi:hypothetical protein
MMETIRLTIAPTAVPIQNVVSKIPLPPASQPHGFEPVRQDNLMRDMQSCVCKVGRRAADETADTAATITDKSIYVALLLAASAAAFATVASKQ